MYAKRALVQLLYVCIVVFILRKIDTNGIDSSRSYRIEPEFILLLSRVVHTTLTRNLVPFVLVVSAAVHMAVQAAAILFEYKNWISSTTVENVGNRSGLHVPYSMYFGLFVKIAQIHNTRSVVTR